MATTGLGQIAADLGARSEAFRHLRLALGRAHEIGETLLLLDILLEIACLLADSDAARSACILAFLVDHPQVPDQRRARAAAVVEALPVANPHQGTTFRQHTPGLSEVMALAMAG